MMESAKAGDEWSQYFLAGAYADSKSPDFDSQEALVWYRRAAEQGFVPAQVELARALASEREVAGNLDEAHRWLKEAVQGECTTQKAAEDPLGYCEIATVGWNILRFHDQAEAGDADSAFRIADAYAFGEFYHEDDSAARSWYIRAAELGDADIKAAVAMTFDLELQFPRDRRLAARWYEAAAKEGHVDSQSAIGRLYEAGDGVFQSDTVAAEWYSKAAERGQATAQRDLGNLYAQGRGVPRDYVLAYKWLSLSIPNSGTLFAPAVRKYLDQVEARMTISQIAEAQRLTREWRASGNGD